MNKPLRAGQTVRWCVVEPSGRLRAVLLTRLIARHWLRHNQPCAVVHTPQRWRICRMVVDE